MDKNILTRAACEKLISEKTKAQRDAYEQFLEIGRRIQDDDGSDEHASTRLKDELAVTYGHILTFHSEITSLGPDPSYEPSYQEMLGNVHTIYVPPHDDQQQKHDTRTNEEQTVDGGVTQATAAPTNIQPLESPRNLNAADDVTATRLELLQQQLELEREEFELSQRQKQFELKQRRARLEMTAQQLQVNNKTENRSVSETTLGIDVRSEKRFMNDVSPVSLDVLVKNLRRPVAKVEKFSGDPIAFAKFKRQFESNVLTYCESECDKMSMLDQYTVGDANKIVSSCAHLSDRLAFQTAYTKLCDRYGNKQILAHSYVSKALNYEKIKPHDSKALDAYALFLNEIASATQEIDEIRILEYPENMKRLVAKLPNFMFDKWRSYVERKQQEGMLSFSDLTKFVDQEAKKANDPVYGQMAFESLGVFRSNQKRDNRGTASFAASTATSEKSLVQAKDVKPKARGCLFCKKDNHPLAWCYHFAKLEKDKKQEFIRENKCCFRCLKVGHMSKDCKSEPNCKTCNGKHVTAMHTPFQNESSRAQNESIQTQNESNRAEISQSHKKQENNTESHVASSCSNMGAGDGFCTLAIIPVKIENGTKSVDTYAFLDSGSSASFIDENLAKQLGASGPSKKVTLDTMGDKHQMTSKIISNLKISDLNGKNNITLPSVMTKNRIPVSQLHIPTQQDIVGWDHLRDVTLPQINGKIGLLLGNNVPDILVPQAVKRGPKGSPVAIKSKLGWIVYNVIRESEPGVYSVNRTSVIEMQEVSELEKLENMYRESVQLDFPEKQIDEKKENSQEDNLFMKKVSDSVHKTDGHYEMCLPFREEQVNLKNNKQQAEQRLSYLKKKMVSDETYCRQYKEFMADMIAKGYAEKVPQEEINRSDGKVFYIPHFGVYHPKKPQKIRVVFDCAAKCDGESLNDKLLQGPNLTNNLIGVLMRFRENTVAVTADVEAMFHRVRVNKEDRDCLRFLWWPDGDVTKPPDIYRMCVHLFGATSSPSCANYALRKTAEDNKQHYDSCTVSTVMNEFYVDDCLKSIETEAQAQRLVKDLTDLCRAGGFKLHKWVSNSRDVLQTISQDARAQTVKELNLKTDELPVERTLGMFWCVETDSLCYKIDIPTKPLTRRGILSVTSSIYDPLGLVSPFVLPAKALLQKLCKKGYRWDFELSDFDAKIWHKWLQDIQKIEEIKIPRCYKPRHFMSAEYELHTFCDASEIAYAAVCYLRIINGSEVTCSLVMAKSRVAPIKQQTIVRLELMASTVGVKLAKIVQDELSIKLKGSYFWTDSMAVLRYLSNTSTRFHTFAANRIGLIREATSLEQWSYVNTKVNPADIASRGLSVADEQNNSVWFSGPKFLYEHNITTDMRQVSLELSSDDPEVKKEVCVATACTNVSEAETELFGRISSSKKLVSMFCYVLKFVFNLKYYVQRRKTLQKQNVSEDDIDDMMGKEKTSQPNHDVTPEDLQNTRMFLYRWVQQKYFPEEIEQLRQGQAVKRSSPTFRLDPIYQDGLIRVGGRLEKANLDYNVKHPILLPKQSYLSKLIVRSAHQEVGHLGKNTILAKIRQNIWIIGVAKLANDVVKQCVTCRKYRGKLMEQKMASLPEERVTADVPVFSKCGVDFMGPIEIKVKRSTVKRYVMVFTCLVTRAVHLEVAASLDTDSCINAIRRFVSRRGDVEFIRSDNGTNFVGAKHELQKEFEKLNKSKVSQFCAGKNITWKFNPPGASHFGGVWERIIRSVRQIMYGLLKEQNITFDEEGLRTLCCEVENILNNRPLTQMSNDPNDLTYLTPNNLILNRSGATCPPGIFEKGDNYTQRKYKQIQYFAQMFWQRWRKEYVTLLNQRSKWQCPTRNVQVGDIVLVADTSPRNSWYLALVTEVYKDKNGLVRIAKIKAKSGEFMRPIHKLCLVLENNCN